MPDFAMCSGVGCPMKNDCYRATATPDKYRQTYFAGPPVVSGLAPDVQLHTIKLRRIACQHYWPVAGAIGSVAR